MRRSTPFRLTLIAAAAALAGAGAQAAPLAMGPQFQLTPNPTDGNAPGVAMTPEGTAIFAWSESVAGDGSGSGIVARIFPANYTSIVPVPAVAINSTTAGDQTSPSVAASAAGDFVVAWAGTGGADGSTSGIRMKRFDLTGASTWTEVAVNTVTAGSQYSPQVAVDADGNGVVAWIGTDTAGTGIKARRFGTSLPLTAAEFQVNTVSTGNQYNPDVAMAPDGQYVIVWQSTDAASGSPIRARVFDPSGGAISNEIVVSTSTTTSLSSPSVAMDAVGNFMVAWSDPSTGIRARRFTPAGVARSSEVTVSSVGLVANPSVSADANGDFTIAWEGYISTTGQTVCAIRLRRFDGAGSTIGNETTVNNETSCNQLRPGIAADADGDLAIGWPKFTAGQGVPVSLSARLYKSREPIDLVLTQGDVDPAFTGGELRYDLRVSNLHPTVDIGVDDRVQGAIGVARQVKVQLPSPPPGVTSGPTITSTDWVCPPINPIACTLSKVLHPGEFAPVLSVAYGAPERPGTVEHPVRVSAPVVDPDTANNTDTEITTVQCAPSVFELASVSTPVSENAGTVTVTVTRGGGTCEAASVRYDTDSDSARAGADFIDTLGVVDWAAGEGGSKTFALSIVNDGLDENSERFRVTLSHPAGGTLGANSVGQVVIGDDDAAPRVNWTAAAQRVTEDPALVTLTAVLSTASGRDITLPLVFTGGTANLDYFAGTNRLVIPAGQTQVSTQVEIVEDNLQEGDETVSVKINSTAAGGAVAGSLSTQAITIADDD